MVSTKNPKVEAYRMAGELIRVLVIPSSDYLGHPFPQRHNHLFERVHDGRDFEVHVIRFNIFGKPRLNSRCVIHEIPLELKIGKTAPYYLANMVSYTSEILNIVRRESIDVVFAGNLLPPLTFSLINGLRERRIPVVFDLQDYYPTSATGYIVDVDSIAGSILKGLFEVMTRYLIGKADVVTVPGVALALYARRVGARSINIVPNGISELFLVKHDGGRVRRALGYAEDDIVVGYIGSIEFWLDMESLIKAIAKARGNGLPVKLLLVGGKLQSGYPRKVKEWLSRYGVEGVTTWLNFIPHDRVPEYIAAMDIATIPFNVNNPTAYYAAPNKLWECLSQGVTVAATSIPEVLSYKHLDCLHIVRNTEDYITIIRRKERCWSSRTQQLLQSKLWDHSATKLKRILRKLANPKIN
jgi:glycosyltransferase involved in cell wall biosynthesis